ncbi:MAG: hypothetical protein JWR59_603 [Brevundimonas sp.]|nr:hypothetical protein [Brevundimonas sp.]
MSSFTRAVFEPTGETLNGRAVYRAAEAFDYDIGYLGSGLRVRVEQGFPTDGPSVPFWALPIFPVGAMVRSAAIHDTLRADPRFTTLEADAIFLAAMQAEGTPAWARELAFLFVRLNRSR